MDFLNSKAELILVFVALSGFGLTGPADATNGKYNATNESLRLGFGTNHLI